MNWLNGNFSDAMRLVAELTVAARMVKESSTQEARKSLGVLGADEGGINSAVSSLRSGKITPGKAVSKIKGTVPGVMTQAANVPAAVSTAMKGGRPDEAMAQADILGLKGLVPGSDHFAPVTGMLGAAAGTTAAAGQHLLHKNRLMTDILHGKTTDHVNALNSAMENASTPESLKTWRQNNLPNETAAHGYTDVYKKTPGGFGAKAKAVGAEAKEQLRRSFLGPRNSTQIAASVNGTPAVSINRKQLNAAISRLPDAVRARSRLAAIGVPIAAATLPLMYREWLSGGGYRSGDRPARELVAGNTGKG